MGDATCLIDDFGPLPLHQPTSTAELADMVRRAGQEAQSLYPVGGGTMLGMGNRPFLAGWAVSLAGLQQVIEYPARDMTITVQSGITMARLQEILAPENQRLPIDVPHADRATLGGVLAANMSGSRRFGYGTLRDYVLGISAVNDEGHEIKGGGRVVKNVAGYDLCKLFVGSLGTLGIITQATLKLRPRAEEQALITLGCSADNVEEMLQRLERSRTRPVILDLLNHGAAHWFNEQGASCGDSAWTIVVGFEGNAEAVEWQVQQLIRELPGGCTLEAWVGAPARPLERALVEFVGYEGGLTFKANLLPSATFDFCRRVDALTPRPLLQAHAGNGIVVGHWEPDCAMQDVVAALQQTRELAAHGQGRVVVTRCAGNWKNSISVWGPPRDDVWLMRNLKEKFDPRGLFNPGRFVDGI
jgi:glycolate oxidase FAD binding subunit